MRPAMRQAMRKLIKISKGFYDIGNTGMSVRMATSGAQAGKWFVIDANDNIWIDCPQVSRRDAVDFAMGDI